MRRAREIIKTPIGNIFTVDLDGAPYFNIKEVCAGIGLRGHSPWSWHAERGDNRERYYKRYSTQRRDFTDNTNGHGSITMISCAGLSDYLQNPRLRNGLAVMFKAWLETTYPKEKQESASDDVGKYLHDLVEYGPKIADANARDRQVPQNQISMDQHEATRDLMPAQPKRWRVQYVCPSCGFQSPGPYNHCPECTERLVLQ